MTKAFVPNAIPGPLSRQLISRVNKVIPLAECASLYGICLKSAKGMYLTDVDGNVYLDFLAGASVVSVGYGRKDVIDVYDQAALRLQHSCFPYSPNQEAIELAEKLVEITPGNFAKKVLFGLSGSDSVDAAIKIARRFTGKPRMISFHKAYHGSTGFSIAVNGFGRLQEGLYLEELVTMFDFPVVEGQVEQILDEIETLLKNGDVAGIIVEPFQGDGGNNVSPDGFHAELCNLAHLYGAVFIVDEVQTGMGRTGKWWGIEAIGVTPDILCAAKGLTSGYVPLSACVAREEMAACLGKSQHLFSYSGHPPSCAVARKVIDIIEQEGLVANAAQCGKQLKRGLKQLQAQYDCIVDVRGEGLHLGMEVEDRKTGKPLGGLFALRSVEKGLYPGYFGESNNVMRLHPPLIVKIDEIDFAVSVIGSVVEEWERGIFPEQTMMQYRQNSFGLGEG